jgi:hypothetical protein
MTMMMTFPTPDPDLTVKVETEELLPFSPESMHTPSSTHANVSDFEDDSDSNFIYNNNDNNDICDNDICDNIDGKPRSAVVTRFRGPAASTNDLQQKEQNRVSAIDRSKTSMLKFQTSKSQTSKSQTSKWQTSKTHSLKSQLQLLAVLVWMNLIGPLQMTSFQSEINQSEWLKIPLESNLPPKKRSHWWGSHRPCPHAKT